MDLNIVQIHPLKNIWIGRMVGDMLAPSKRDICTDRANWQNLITTAFIKEISIKTTKLIPVKWELNLELTRDHLLMDRWKERVFLLGITETFIEDLLKIISCMVMDSFTTVHSSEWTRPHPIFWEESSHTSPSDILPDKPLEDLSTKEDMLNSISKEYLWLTTQLLSKAWESSESTVLKIWSTKSSLLVLTSKKPTTSYGPSN